MNRVYIAEYDNDDGSGRDWGYVLVKAETLEEALGFCIVTYGGLSHCWRVREIDVVMNGAYLITGNI